MNKSRLMAIGLFVASLIVWHALGAVGTILQAQGGASGNNGTSIANEQFDDWPANHGYSYVASDGNIYCFTFSATICCTMECCEETWSARLELWEDDTISDDFVGYCDWQEFECGSTPAENCHRMQCEVCMTGTELHDRCGTGSDWEMEIRVSTSSACGDDHIDPPGWELAQPNTP